MAIEQTLSIIKPDAVAKNVIGDIYSRFEKAGLKIIKAKMIHLSKEEAEGFYEEYLKDVRSSFNKVVIRKPDASRPRSREVYIVAKGFKH